MSLKLVIITAFLMLTIPSIAQDTAETAIPENSIEGQFKDVIEGSNNYQEYKVIKKFKINKLRENILDSIATLETTINESQEEIATQNTEIGSLKNSLTKTEEDLALSQKKENGIEFLGILTQKSTYNAIMWSIVGILILALAFFIYKFKNSHAVTKSAQLKLAETEIEFEAHRQKKLTEIQQVRRKLQDEINKNRKLQS